MKRNILSGALVLLLSATTGGYADTLTRGTKHLTGRFTGIDQSRFTFEDSSGKLHKTHQSFVAKLDLDEPTPVTFMLSGKREEYTGVLHGYRSGRFTIEMSGTERMVPGPQIKSLSIRDLEAEAQKTAAAAGPRVKNIDSTALRKRPDLTANQSAILDRYDSDKKRYDGYLGQSSDMVAKMDATKGAQRGKLLAVLRHRKAEEQPLKNAYESSRDALLAAFPNMQTAQAGKQTWSRPGTLELRIPNYEEGTILLIDTGFLKDSGRLNPDQESAIKSYNAAKNKYTQYAAQPPPDSDATRANLSTSLMTSQKALLGAFPNLTIRKD